MPDVSRMALPGAQALILPQYWSKFIRSGAMDEVRPLGLGAPAP
jgi:hypothetical protein